MVAICLDRRLRGAGRPSDVIQEGYLDAMKRLKEYIRDPSVPFGRVGGRGKGGKRG
jgi:RNA polymerase sigma-70 factor, ECF subfamily